MTRGELLYHALLFQLGQVKVTQKAGRVSPEDRERVAQRVLAELKAHGDTFGLNEEMKPADAPTTTGHFDVSVKRQG